MVEIVPKNTAPPIVMQHQNKNIANHGSFHCTPILFTSSEFKSTLNKHQWKTEHPVDDRVRLHGRMVGMQGKRSRPRSPPSRVRGRLIPSHPPRPIAQSDDDSLNYSHILPPPPHPTHHEPKRLGPPTSSHLNLPPNSPLPPPIQSSICIRLLL